MLKVILIASILGIVCLGFFYKPAFAAKFLVMQNPLFSKQELPVFADIKPEHFVPAIEDVLNNYNKVLVTQVLVAKNPTWNNTIQLLEEESNKISRVLNLIEHINLVANTDAVRQAYEEVLPKITTFNTELMQNEKLYQLYLQLEKSKEFKSYNAAQQTIIRHAVRDFKLSGVNLAQDKREQFKAIQHKLSELGNQFSKNVLDASQAWEYHVSEENKAVLAGIPAQNIAIAKEKAEKKQKPGWILTIDAPCYSAVMSFAKDSNLRKTFYTAYNTKASDQGPMAGKWDNTAVINEILKLRQELAALLGLNNYAEYSIVPKMAKDTKQVMDFLLDLTNHAKQFARQEFAVLTEFAKQQDNIGTLNAWDTSYYAELYQQKNYNISPEALRPYFPEQQVLSGMFQLAERLFGVKISEVANVPKWHDSVKLFAVNDANGNLRGKFYTDLYARDFKQSGAWMADFLPRMRFSNGKLQTPIAFLEANFTPAVSGGQALLSHNEILTLFHEFGHTLHHILTQVDYSSVAGTQGVAWDAVELPSQFMENWCWEWEVVKELSKHHETGEQLPKRKFNQLLAIKNYNSALQILRQVEFAIFDFRLHLNNPEDMGKSTQQILDEVRQQIAVVPVPNFNRFQNSFSHIFVDGGYEAGYYSYHWAEVLSSDAFEAFKENGTFNPAIGQKFLHTILEQGGSHEAMELFVEFRGRKPTIDAFLKHNGLVVNK